MTQSLDATFRGDAAGVQDADDGELASLVRRWMTAGRQERLRRDTVLRVAPRVDDEEPVLAAGPDEAPAAEVETSEAEAAKPRVELEAQPAVQIEVLPEAHVELEVETDVETDVVAEVPVESPTAPALQAPAPRTPPLPHRPTADETEHARRIAVLIDARRVDDDVAAGLLSRLGERGTINVCRAYADWSRSDLGAWVGRMRRQGLHSFHQFADDDEQALVAMAIDAVDIARDAAIDEIVIVGDMTSMLPLVHRLHAAGVVVVVVGPGHTPHDVRGACDEFIDTALIGTHEIAPVGRHRA